MRALDLIKLGATGLKSHKRQTFTVVLLVGLLFGILAAIILVLRGLEQVTLAAMLAPTDGQVVLQSSVDMNACGENCDVEAEIAQIQANVQKYGGEVVDFTQPSGFMGTYYQLEDEIFTAQPNPNVAADVPQVLVPLTTAASLIGYKLPDTGASAAERLQAAREVRAATVGQTITTALEQQYYIVDILPSGDLAGNLAFANLGQNNPLDLILAQIYSGSSQNFVLKATAQPENSATNATAPTATPTSVFAKFSDLESANAYYHDPANYCEPLALASLSCSESYRFTTYSIISNPLEAYDMFQNSWSVAWVVAIVVIVVALIITVATYSRIIGKDQKIIRLYFALSANTTQVRSIYLVYLLELSLLALVFATLLGVGVALGLSLIWQNSLTQLFTLSLNIQLDQIWLLGLHPILGLIAVALLVAPLLTILLEHKQLKARR